MLTMHMSAPGPLGAMQPGGSLGLPFLGLPPSSRHPGMQERSAAGHNGGYEDGYNSHSRAPEPNPMPHGHEWPAPHFHAHAHAAHGQGQGQAMHHHHHHHYHQGPGQARQDWSRMEHGVQCSSPLGPRAGLPSFAHASLPSLGYGEGLDGFGRGGQGQVQGQGHMHGEGGYPRSPGHGGYAPAPIHAPWPSHGHAPPSPQSVGQPPQSPSFTGTGSPLSAGAGMGYNGPSSKTKVCRYYLGRANNHFGKSCSYVHPCRNILISGSCKHGRRCTDDHVCRDYVFYGDSGPHGCKAGDACRLIHVKQDVDRAALIDMYRDWIAVKQHEAIAAQTLGSASAAASVVQTEIMMAAAVTTPAAPAGRVSCPFWYTDTMAGCKAGPDCVYEHAGQFQLPTRPLPTPAQTKFAERAWEKRRAQEAAATPTTLTLQPGGTPRSMVGSGASDSSSPFSLQPASGSLAMDNSDQSSHGPSVLSLGDGHGPVAAQQGSLLAPKAALAADFSNLLNPSPVITQALQMASIMSGPPTPAPMSHTASTSSAGRSPRMPHHSPGNSMGMGATGPMMATGQAHMPGKRRTTPPKRNLDAVPAPGTLGADLLLPSPGAASAIGPRPALSSSLGLMGMDMSNMGEGGVHSLQNALAGLTM